MQQRVFLKNGRFYFVVGFENTAALLIDKHADVNVKGQLGYTALMHAAEKGRKFNIFSY